MVRRTIQVQVILFSRTEIAIKNIAKKRAPAFAGALFLYLFLVIPVCANTKEVIDKVT